MATDKGSDRPGFNQIVYPTGYVHYIPNNLKFQNCRVDALDDSVLANELLFGDEQPRFTGMKDIEHEFDRTFGANHESRHDGPGIDREREIFYAGAKAAFLIIEKQMSDAQREIESD